MQWEYKGTKGLYDAGSFKGLFEISSYEFKVRTIPMIQDLSSAIVKFTNTNTQ